MTYREFIASLPANCSVGLSDGSVYPLSTWTAHLVAHGAIDNVIERCSFTLVFSEVI